MKFQVIPDFSDTTFKFHAISGFPDLMVTVTIFEPRLFKAFLNGLKKAFLELNRLALVCMTFVNDCL